MTPEQELQQLKAWKQEAMQVYEPIVVWGQNNKELPLGSSIVSEVMKRVNESEAKDKEIERLRGLMQKMMEWVNDAGLKEVALDSKPGMAIYHIKHLLIEALQTKEV